MSELALLDELSFDYETNKGYIRNKKTGRWNNYKIETFPAVLYKYLTKNHLNLMWHYSVKLTDMLISKGEPPSTNQFKNVNLYLVYPNDFFRITGLYLKTNLPYNLYNPQTIIRVYTNNKYYNKKQKRMTLWNLLYDIPKLRSGLNI